MRKFLFAAFILYIGVNFSYAQEKPKDENKEKKVEQQTVVEDGKPINTICPVSMEEADQEITFTYEGKTYAVCCNNCLKKLKADPERYISRLDEDGNPIKKK